jgi:Undecaprenyl-phosphate glucose phosphotransferase
MRVAVQLVAGEGERLPGRATSSSGSRISPLACSCALVISDSLLVGGIAATCLFGGLASLASPSNMLILAYAALVPVLALWREGAYTMERAGSGLAAVVIGWLNASGLLALSMFALDALSASALREGTPDPVSLTAFVVTGGAAVLGRGVVWVALRPRVAAQLARNPAVVAGAGAGVFAVAELLRRESETTQVVAVVSDLETDADEVVALVRNGVVRTVFITLSPANAEAAGPLLTRLAAFSVAVRIVPDITSIAVRPRGVSLEAGLPVFHISDPPFSPAADFVKRAEDVVLALLLLLAAGPIILLASLAIKIETPGPVLFRQPRHGLNGSVIEVIKFRTMYAHLADRLASIQTSRVDPRVTRVGAFLRRHSLDELPQLFNVLAGTMSLVGPRPHAPATTAAGQSLELAVATYMARHRVRPGITGWAQVSGWRGNLDSVEKAVRRVEHDLYYIENWSLLFDLWIIVRTIGLVLHDGKAY